MRARKYLLAAAAIALVALAFSLLNNNGAEEVNVEIQDFSASVIEAEKELTSEHDHFDIYYQFNLPAEWEAEVLYSAEDIDQIQYRDNSGEIVMNISCPWLELDYSSWDLAESLSREFNFNKIPYQVKYKYFVPKSDSSELDSVVIIEMNGAKQGCQINAQSPENRLEALKSIYESIIPNAN